MSSHDDDVLDPQDERGSEVEDFTSETTRPSTAQASATSDFGAGDAIDLEGLDDLTEGDDSSSNEAADEAAAEIERFRELAMRTQADFENYRKRVANQIIDEVDRATSRVAAYLRHPDEVGPLLNVLLVELRKAGLETMDIADKPFDPETAEAVAHEAGDGGDIVVAEVLRSGYSWKGRTLRPAMVRTKD
jgi:molecular chaperone GrpE